MKRMSPSIEIDPSGYCARCLEPAHERAVACSRCETPFEGAGRFDRIAGPLPSRTFDFLFSNGTTGNRSSWPA